MAGCDPRRAFAFPLQEDEAPAAHPAARHRGLTRRLRSQSDNAGTFRAAVFVLSAPMHKDADGNWVADLDPAPDAIPVTGATPGSPPPPPGATPASAVPPPPPSADPAGAGFALPSGVCAGCRDTDLRHPVVRAGAVSRVLPPPSGSRSWSSPSRCSCSPARRGSSRSPRRRPITSRRRSPVTHRAPTHRSPPR